MVVRFVSISNDKVSSLVHFSMYCKKFNHDLKLRFGGLNHIVLSRASKEMLFGSYFVCTCKLQASFCVRQRQKCVKVDWLGTNLWKSRQL